MLYAPKKTYIPENTTADYLDRTSDPRRGPQGSFFHMKMLQSPDWRSRRSATYLQRRHGELYEEHNDGVGRPGASESSLVLRLEIVWGRILREATAYNPTPFPLLVVVVQKN